jgi:hypothetical protein
MKQKIVVVGFHKTATTTLSTCLSELGFNVATKIPRQTAVFKHKYEQLLEIFDAHDAVRDIPWFKLYKVIDRERPGCKFILTERHPEKWFNSVARHIGKRRTAWHEWLYGQGKGVPSENKENAIDIYSRHNQEVRAYFKDRPNDLLIIDFTTGDGWEKLCDFLQVPVPSVEIPHSNQASVRESRTTGYTVLRRRIKEWFKIRYYRAVGLL